MKRSQRGMAADSGRHGQAVHIGRCWKRAWDPPVSSSHHKLRPPVRTPRDRLSCLLDVPRELVRHLAGLLAAERRVLGTRKNTRALTCWYHALLVLVWYRKGEDLTLLAAGFGVSRATAYRYRDEACGCR
jgi:hypothetical protein